MNKIKNSGFFKVISLVLILTFISLDISYAYPPEHNAENSTLAAPSALQQYPMTTSAKELQDSILADGSILGTVCSIGEFLLDDGIHLKYLSEVLSRELGDNAKYIDLSRVTVIDRRDNSFNVLGPTDNIPHDAIVWIPYNKDGNSGAIEVALKDSLSKGMLAGYEWVVSDKYAVKVRPSGYTQPAPAQPVETKEADVTISEPIAEVVVPVNKTEAPENTAATNEGSRITIRAIVKHVLAIAIMFVSLFTMPSIGRSAAQALDPAAKEALPNSVDPLLAIGFGVFAFDSSVSVVRNVISAAIALTLFTTAVAASVGFVVLLIRAKHKYFPSSWHLPAWWHIWRLESDNRKTRQTAARELANIYSLDEIKDPREVKVLITTLNDYRKNKDDREFIILTLVTTGRYMADLLTRASHSANPTISNTAKEILTKMAERLVEQLHSNKSAPEALIRIGSPAVRPLTERLESRGQYAAIDPYDSTVTIVAGSVNRALVAEILGRIKDRRVYESLIMELAGTKEGTINSAAEALLNKGWKSVDVSRVMAYYAALGNLDELSEERLKAIENLSSMLETAHTKRSASKSHREDGKLYSSILPTAIFGLAALDSPLSAVEDFISVNPVIMDIVTNIGLFAAAALVILYALSRYIKKVRSDATDSSQKAAEGIDKSAAQLNILAVPNLIDLLESGDSSSRANAATSLGKIGPLTSEVTPALLKALGDEDSGVRGRVVDAFSEISSVTPEVILALIKMLNDPDSHVQRRTAIAFSKIDSITPEATAALMVALENNNYEAAATLGQIYPLTPEIFPALIKALKEGDSDVRRAAALALGKIQPLTPEIITARIEALKDSDSDVLGSVIDTLGDSGPVTPEVIPAITKMLQYRDSYVRDRAAKALEKLGAMTEDLEVKRYIADLTDPSSEVRINASETLKKRGISKPEYRVKRYIVDLGNKNNNEVRRQAAIALLSMQDSRLGDMIEYLKCVRKYDHNYYVPLSDSDVESIVGSLDRGDDLNLVYKPFIKHNGFSEIAHGGREITNTVYSRARLLIPGDAARRKLPLPEIPDLGKAREILPPYAPDVPAWGLKTSSYDKLRDGMELRSIASIENILDKRNWLWDSASDEKRSEVLSRINRIRPKVPAIVGTLYENNIISSETPLVSIYITGSFPWTNSPNDLNIVVVVEGDREFSRIRGSNLPVESKEIAPDTGVSFEVVGLETLKRAAEGEDFDEAKAIRRKLIVYSGAVPLAGIDIFDRSTPPLASYKVMRDDIFAGVNAAINLWDATKYDEDEFTTKILARREEAEALEAWIAKKEYGEDDGTGSMNLFSIAALFVSAFSSVEKFTAAYPGITVAIEIGGSIVLLYAIWRTFFSAEWYLNRKYDTQSDALRALRKARKLLRAKGIEISAGIGRVSESARQTNGKWRRNFLPVYENVLEISERFTIIVNEIHKNASGNSSITDDELTSGRIIKPQSIESITASIMKELKKQKEMSLQKLFVTVQDEVPVSMTRLHMALKGLKPLSESEGVSADVMSQEINLAISRYMLSREETKILWLALTGPGQGAGVGKEDSGDSKPEESVKAPETPEAPLLLDISESWLNNNSAKFIETSNSIVDLYATNPDPDDVAGVVALNRKMTTAEIKNRVERAIAGIEKSEKDAISLTTRLAIDTLKKDMTQFEADGGITSLIVLARRAKRENQKLIIGLETDWIPPVGVKHTLQRSAISLLMREIDAIGDALKSMGLDNVEVIRGSSVTLADDLKSMKNKTNTSMRNIVAIASIGTINSSSFGWLKNADEDDRPFIAGINPAKLIDLYAKYEEDTKNQLHIRLMELLYMTLELAAGKEPPQIPVISFYDKNMRLVIFLPDASPMDYEVLRNAYAAEKTALVAA